jgi:hypothetical protein
MQRSKSIEGQTAYIPRQAGEGTAIDGYSAMRGATRPGGHSSSAKSRS